MSPGFKIEPVYEQRGAESHLCVRPGARCPAGCSDLISGEDSDPAANGRCPHLLLFLLVSPSIPASLPRFLSRLSDICLLADFLLYLATPQFRFTASLLLSVPPLSPARIPPSFSLPLSPSQSSRMSHMSVFSSAASVVEG